MSEARCTACGENTLAPCFELASVPALCNVPHESEGSARAAPRGDLRLGCCPACGMIRNLAFDPAKVRYAPDYENALHHSARFRAYADVLARRLFMEYDLPGKCAVEVGCGDGYFLRLLASLGLREATGFDPGLPAEVAEEGFALRRGQAPPGFEADLTVCRHVLEHVADPGPFLASLAAQGSLLYLEVPDARHTLFHGGVWDLLYEHCSYFAPGALQALLARTGFTPLRVEPAFEGQFLQVDARRRAGTHERGADAGAVVAEAGRLQASYESARRLWADEMRARARSRSRVVLWGAGTKGVMFLNAIDRERTIGCVVDVNPRKQGRFVAGTGHPILAPEHLRTSPPDLVVAMNAAYAREIEVLLDRLGIRAEVRAA